MRSSALAIGTLRATILLSAEHPDPTWIGAGIGAALDRHLRSSLALALGPLEDDTDTTVWLIRRLDVEADVNAAWDPDVVVGAISKAIARSLGRELAGTGD